MVQAQEFIDGLDGKGLLFERLVGLDQCEQRGFLVRLQEFPDLVDAQTFDLGAFLGIHPGRERSELAEDFGPLRFRQRILAGFEHEAAHRLDGCLPGGVHGIQRKHPVGRRLGQRLLADGIGSQREVAFDGADLLDGNAHGLGSVGIETDELAAHEIVGHLVFERFDGGTGVGGLVAEGEDVRYAGILPGGILGQRGVEGFDVVGRHAVLAAAVHGLADGFADGGHQGGERFAVRAGGRDDSVAVELRIGEDLHIVRGIFQRDAVFLQFEVLENLLGRGEQLGTVRILRIKVGEGDLGTVGEQRVGIFQDPGQPLGGGDDFIDPDVSVVVGIQQVEGLLVKFQIAGGTAQDCPHLTVQFTQPRDVCARSDLHAHSPAHRGKSPGIRGVFHRI